MSVDWDALAKKTIMIKHVKIPPIHEYKPRVPKVSMERDILVEIGNLVDRIMSWKRFNPDNPENIERNRQEPIILKKLKNKIEEVLK